MSIVGYRIVGQVLCCKCAPSATACKTFDLPRADITDDEHGWEKLECTECGETLEDVLALVAYTYRLEAAVQRLLLLMEMLTAADGVDEDEWRAAVGELKNLTRMK